MGIWTPRHGKMAWVSQGPPVPFPRTERDFLRNELAGLGYFVAGSDDAALVPTEQLRDIVQACREKKAAQDAVDAEAGEGIFDTMDPEQRRGAMLEFIRWRNRRRDR